MANEVVAGHQLEVWERNQSALIQQNNVFSQDQRGETLARGGRWSLPERDYHPGIGGMGRQAPSVDHIEGEKWPPELYPYGLPAPPKAFFFGGTGWGYGLGCTLGPFFGVGVGYGVRGKVLFGAGAGTGAVCGVGFGSGLILGAGTAYVPLGFNISLFYAPKWIRLERAFETWRLRRTPEYSRDRWKKPSFYMWPKPLRDLGYRFFAPLLPEREVPEETEKGRPPAKDNKQQ